jgi:hypothetical protein
MKKVKIKALSNLAQRLPESYVIVNNPSLIKGEEISLSEFAELRAKGVEIPIEGDKWYKKANYKLEKIDHFNRLKNAYAKKKEQGILDYITWLDNHNKKLNEKFEDLRLAQVDEGILNVVKKGASSFWSNIIQFLAAFYHAFIKKEKSSEFVHY